MRPKNSWLLFYPPSLKKELWKSYCNATEDQTTLVSLSQFSEYQPLQPGLYGKRRGYHQSPVVNSSRVEQDITDQRKTKLVRYLSTGVKLSLGSLSHPNDSNRNVKRRIDLLKQKHYLCACLLSISYTGFKQACSVQLFKKNLPSIIFHCQQLPLFCQSVRIVVLRVKTYKKYKQTINNKHSLRPSS